MRPDADVEFSKIVNTKVVSEGVYDVFKLELKRLLDMT